MEHGRVSGTILCKSRANDNETYSIKIVIQVDHVRIQCDLDYTIFGCIYALDGRRRKSIFGQCSKFHHMAIDNYDIMGKC